MKWADENSDVVVPQLCGGARGIAGTDYSTKQGQSPGPWDHYAKPNEYDKCWYAMSKFRPLYPEFKNLSDKELSSKLYADYGIPIRDLTNPWVTMMWTSAVAFTVPLIVLILGLAFIWAFAGFAAQQE